MRRVPSIGVFVLLMAATGFAQSTIGPANVRCPDCAASGQTAATAPVDVSQLEFVANPVPAFHENRTIRINVIARVLQPAPLLLEVLDARMETVDRNMRAIQEPSGAPDDVPGCVLVDPHQPIDLASKPAVLALRMNDIVAANVILNRDPNMPDAILAATPTLSDVRKAAAPVPLFHTSNVKAECANRSGRLVEYLGPEDGDLTIVYNDGGIYYRNAAYLTFTREKLSPAELSDLLRAFREVNFDALPTAFPQKQSANRPALALMATRYQRVALTDGDARLAPLMKRIDALADRATSHARYVVKADRGVPIVVRPWPNADVDLVKLADPRIRNTNAAPVEWQQRVPDDVLASLPAEANTLDEANRDPNRLNYFSQGGRLYRVARPFFCTGARVCAFRELAAAEVAEPSVGECAQGTMNCQTIIYPNGKREYRQSDPSLTGMSGRLWPQSMGIRLRDVPPEGLTISTDEFTQHKAIYFPILRFRAFGANYIEDGLLYAPVRVCQIEEGTDPATCEAPPRTAR